MASRHCSFATISEFHLSAVERKRKMFDFLVDFLIATVFVFCAVNVRCNIFVDHK